MFECTTDMDELISCAQCDYSTTSAILMRRHHRHRYGERNHRCDECDKAFSTVALLRQHASTKHSSTEHKYNARVACPICDKDMLQRNVQAHVQRVHEGVRRFECNVCRNAFQTRHSLKMHSSAVHSPPVDRRFRFNCADCKAGFDSRMPYEDHVNIHTGARPYKCVECEKTFKQRGVLDRHVDTVHRGLKTVCELCGVTFSSRQYMNRHRAKVHRRKADDSCKVMPTLNGMVLTVDGSESPVVVADVETISFVSVPTTIIYLQNGNDTMVAGTELAGSTADEILRGQGMTSCEGSHTNTALGGDGMNLQGQTDPTIRGQAEVNDMHNTMTVDVDIQQTSVAHLYEFSSY